MPYRIVADDIVKYLFNFSEKIRLGTSSELSAQADDSLEMSNLISFEK